jgi:Na+/H+-dicarboxylate symporter
MIPDIFRTLGNVTMDVAVTTIVDRQTAASA